AARSAGMRGDRGASAGLLNLLRDPDAAVRREAAIALGKVGDPAAGRPLLAALGDPDPFAAWSIRHAIRALGAWEEAGLVAALLDPNRSEDALKLCDEAWALPVVEALSAAIAKAAEPSARAKLVTT